MRFSVIDVPGSVKLPARATCSAIVVLLRIFLSLVRKSERLSHHFFTFLPERFGTVGIHCIRAYAVGHGVGSRVVRNDGRHMAVFTIPASDLARGSDDSRPHRSRGSL